MARLNLYEKQTSAQSPRADGYTMGTAPAQALEGAGNALADIGYRVQKREELGVSQHVMENAEQMAQTALTDLGRRQDINTPKAMADFEQVMQQIRQNGMTQFAGSAEGRAALENRLDNQLAQYRKSAIATKIEAGHLQMGRALDQQFKKSTLEVDAAPDIWSLARDENLATVEMWKPAMSKEQYEQAKMLAHAKPLQAAAQSLLARKDYDAADKLINDPETSKFLTVDALRPLRIDVAVGRGKMEQEERKIEGDRKSLSYLLGKEATREQALTVPDISSMPAVQKLNVLRMMNGGRDLPVETVNRVMGVERQTSESRIDQIVELSSNYDTLDAPGRMKLTALIKSEWRDINGVDSLGNPTRYPTVPAEFARFVSPTGGRPGAGGITSSVATPGGEGTLVDANGNTYPEGTRLKMPDGVEVTIDARGHAVAKDGGGGPSSEPAEKELINLYENADNIVGLESWVKRNAANLPLGIGDFIKVNPVYGQAAKAAQIIQNDIVRGFVNMGGGKDVIANQYRQELKGIVSIDPALFASTREYRVKLKTIDSELRSKLKEYQTTAQSGATQEMRQAAAEGVAVINKVISRLDIPQKTITNQKDYEKLQPGERYLYLDDPTPRTKGGRK